MSYPKASADELRARAENLRSMFPTDGNVWDDARLYDVAADTIDALVKQLADADRQFTALKESSGKADARAVELAAVVEKVRDAIGRAEIAFDIGVPWDRAVDDSHEAALSALSAAPADALAEHDVRLIEGLADEWHAENTGTSPRMYAWLSERARLIREGDKK